MTDITTDTTTNTTNDTTHKDFFRENPLSFGLYNYYQRNDYNTLYINDNPDDLRFNLEIKNVSTQTLMLSKSTQSELESPSLSDYHIELKFRPDQLSQRSREKIDLSEVSKEGWSMSRPYENRDRTVSLFLLKRQDDLVIEKGKTEVITLIGLGANSIEGTRVTQLEINCQDFYVAHEKSDTYRQRQIITLTILNYAGKKAASLTVTFAYAPTLLNNGSEPQSLVLQIINTGQDAITLNEKSRFEITIDAEGDREQPWALAKKDEALECKVFLPNNPHQKYWIIEGPDIEVEDPTWIIKPNFTWEEKEEKEEKEDKNKKDKKDKELDRMKKFTLKNDDDFFIYINNFKTSLRSGIGNLQVAYYNLPGYMDKKIILDVTKTCITEVKKSGVGDGGIGINKYPDSETHLDVKGKIASDSLEVKGETVANFLTVKSTVSARKFEGEGAFVTGMIMMWSGAADAIPYGWALCNGDNNTPDLRDRFIVCAGELHKLNDKGDPDQHNHSINIPEKSLSFTTSEAGSHSHRFPTEWYNLTDAIRDSRAGTDFTAIDRGSADVKSSTTQNNGNHSHSGTINSCTLTSYPSEGFNRPKWYALCFIIKIRIRVKDVLETASENLTWKRGDKDIDWSTETGYSLVFQKDGNLVLSKIKNSSREVIWATGTDGKAEEFTASKDGNFALINSQGKPIWSSKTSGRNRLVLEEDGNLVVYSQSIESNKKLFETGTQGGKESTTEAAKAWKE
jgi:hypothetical protein